MPFLSHNKDLLRFMVADKLALDAYGGRAVELDLHDIARAKRDPATTIISLLGRRPNLITIRVDGINSLTGLSRAMRTGLCDTLKELHVHVHYIPPFRSTDEIGMPALLAALQDGYCPHLTNLHLSLGTNNDDMVIGSLGIALRARSLKGRSEPVKMLEFKPPGTNWMTMKDLSHVLDACDGLEQLRIPNASYWIGHVRPSLNGLFGPGPPASTAWRSVVIPVKSSSQPWSLLV